MDRININLLPPELLSSKKDESKKSIFFKVSVIIVVIGLVIVSSVIAARLTQNMQLRAIEQDVEKTREQIANLKQQEELLLSLKLRLDKINLIAKKESPQADAFSLLSKILPEDGVIITYSMDRADKVTVSGEISSPASLDTIFKSLLDPEISAGRVSNIKMENLSRGASERIKFDLSFSYASKGKAAPNPSAVPQ